ncbi:hypothetical protein GH714_012134 [Hevea brasiliensis]|uniref:Uncharacterized protein n=1 Tax=Hevea brasiliensis TaxID=3981 RepID=A0A6A6K823_HEVBR|nr:hypothetical protein GH714_012134 [Hevea brasiliensis]
MFNCPSWLLFHGIRLYCNISPYQTSLVAADVHCGDTLDVLKVFVEMLKLEYCLPDNYTYPIVAKAFSELSLLGLGRVVHRQTCHSGVTPMRRIPYWQSQNYSTWHAQITPLLQGHNLMGYVTGTIICPPTHVEKNGTHISNPDYEFWECQDQLILAAIIASVSFSFMNTIADSKPQRSMEQTSVAEYLQLIKSIAEELFLCGSPVYDVDLIVHVLGGIGLEFHDITAATHARDTVISFDELQDKLLAHELYLKQIDPNFDPTPLTANHVRKANSSRPSHHQRQGNSYKPSNPIQSANSRSQFLETLRALSTLHHTISHLCHPYNLEIPAPKPKCSVSFVTIWSPCEEVFSG